MACLRLENDLRALRLLHDKVIDTAIVSEHFTICQTDFQFHQVFPHDKGPPFRRALRDMYVDISQLSLAKSLW